MIFLINCSNLKVGGALQVADSICRQLDRYRNHQFLVVLSSALYNLKFDIEKYPNVSVYIYNVQNNFSTLVCGRDKFLDSLVRKNCIDVVLTIFGPSRWNPKCKHLCGFAMSHLVLPESPFFTRMNWKNKLKNKLRNKILRYFFSRSTNTFYTENPQISEKLQNLIKNSVVYTVTNNYNQIYDNPSLCKEYKLPKYNGVTLLTISAYYAHKNLEIVVDILSILKKKYPDFNVRFVLTIKKEQFNCEIPNEFKDNILFLGKVNINQCLSLYKQADIMFQPALLECFSATYAEAMKMEIPILTTDLDFSHGLCGDAAMYYSALSAEDAVEKIIQMVNNPEMISHLVVKGKKQLLQFDDYSQRADKIIKILETI